MLIHYSTESPSSASDNPQEKLFDEEFQKPSQLKELKKRISDEIEKFNKKSSSDHLKSG